MADELEQRAERAGERMAEIITNLVSERDHLAEQLAEAEKLIGSIERCRCILGCDGCGDRFDEYRTRYPKQDGGKG